MRESDDIYCSQVEEMYSVPESFLEIEVKNPQTHGEHRFLFVTPSASHFISTCAGTNTDTRIDVQDLGERCTQIMRLLLGYVVLYLHRSLSVSPPPFPRLRSNALAHRPIYPLSNFDSPSSGGATLTLKPFATFSSMNLPALTSRPCPERFLRTDSPTR